MVNILVFGASITWGAWDIEGGWVQRLRKFLDKKNTEGKSDLMVYNLGVSGDTSKWILERFENEIKGRLGEDKTIIIISAGINDSVWVNKTKKLRVKTEDFEKNINKLIEIARKYSSKILFVGLTPCDEKKVDPIPWAPGWSYKNELIKKFDYKTKEVCKQQKIEFIDVYDKLRDSKEVLQDGVHPNSKGHEIIFENVKEFLIKNKIV